MAGRKQSGERHVWSATIREEIPGNRWPYGATVEVICVRAATIVEAAEKATRRAREMDLDGVVTKVKLDLLLDD